LEDALEDSPQTRSLLDVFTQDASALRSYTHNLHTSCQRVMDAQNELCLATQSLSQQIKAYDSQNFPLEGEDSILAMTMKQFAVHIDEVSSVHQVLATQLSDRMMYPIGRFLQADLDEISNMGEMLKISSAEHDNSIARYMNLRKKKDNEKTRQEAVDDLAAMRRKFHQTSLHYFSSLNALQYKRKCSLLEPLLGYLQAQRAAITMGTECLHRPALDDYVSNTAASIQGVQAELSIETQKTVAAISGIEHDCNTLYHVDLPPDTTDTPTTPTADHQQKGGYLLMRCKQALIQTKWERCYFFTQAGNLMCQRKDQVAGSLILDLNETGTAAEAAESDDRRNIFQIQSPTAKKTVILQAESERQRDEWIYIINNIVVNSGYVKGTADLALQSDMSQSAAVSIPKINTPTRNSQGVTPSGKTPATPPSTPSDGGFIPDAPIQFDIISPTDENKPFKTEKEGPPMRINPFTDSAVGIVNDNNADNSSFYQTFEVRFLGCMEVRADRGETLICETIRQIMAARALHNIFRMSDSLLVVSSQAMRLVDPSNHIVRTEFSLKEMSYWAAHQENKRLFGFIVRARVSDKSTFSCHVFECNTSAEEICHAISTATNLAFQALVEKKSAASFQHEEESTASGEQQTENKPDTS